MDKFRSFEQEMNFKLSVVEKELETERKKNTFDISAIDSRLKSEYETR